MRWTLLRQPWKERKEAAIRCIQISAPHFLLFPIGSSYNSAIFNRKAFEIHVSIGSHSLIQPSLYLSLPGEPWRYLFFCSSRPSPEVACNIQNRSIHMNSDVLTGYVAVGRKEGACIRSIPRKRQERTIIRAVDREEGACIRSIPRKRQEHAVYGL